MNFVRAFTSFCIFVSQLIALTATADTVYLPIRATPRTLKADELKIATDNYIFRQLAEGLFAIGDGFEIDPRLATSFTWSQNGKLLSIQLKSARFSDGSPITTEEVIASLQRCVKSAQKTISITLPLIQGYDEFAAGRSLTLSGIQKNGPNSIRIRLKERSPLLLDDLAQAECHIVKPSKTGSFDLLNGAIGSGPYLLENHSNNSLLLKKNLSYHNNQDTQVPWDRDRRPEYAEFRVTDDFGRFEKLKSWVTMTSVEYQPEKDPAFTQIDFSDLGSYQLIFNHLKPPFNKKTIRKAVALALDYKTLAAKMNWDFKRLQAGMIPYGMRGFRQRILQSRAVDLKKANQLLENEGYTTLHPLKLNIYFSKLPNLQKEALYWKDLFSGCPIQVSVTLIPHSEIIQKVNNGDFEVMRVSKFPGSVEPHRLFATYVTGSDYNPTRSHTPTCDQLTRQAIRTVDKNQRFKLYEKVDTCLMDNAILVPLSSFQAGYVLIKKPWKLKRTNRYLLYPYWVSEWSNSEDD